MKKYFITTALTIVSLSIPFSMAQVTVNPKENTTSINCNTLKYGSDLISVGTINVSVAEKIKAKPDIAEFSVRYVTEGAKPSEASTKNSINMKLLTSYLQQLGITAQDLTTISYRNYEQNTQRTVHNPQDKLFETAIKVNVVVGTDKFTEVINLLEKNGISNLEKNRPNDNFYTFTIDEKASDPEAAKQLAQTKYQTIIERLKVSKVDQVSIEKYNNRQSEPTTQDIKTYFVENVIKIRTHHFDNLGKIIAKAQELKMNVNDDMSYTVSDETRNKLIEQAQSQLLGKLTQKANVLLGNNHYQLGAVQNLQAFEDQPIIQPRNYDYNHMITNSGAVADMAVGSSVAIQPPADFDINVTLTGSFDILKAIHKP